MSNNTKQSKDMKINPDQSIVTNVVTAIKDNDGMYKILTAGGPILLSQFLGQVIASRGDFKSLGMAYSQAPGANGMELAVFVVVPSGSPMALAMTTGGKVDEQSQDNPGKEST